MSDDIAAQRQREARREEIVDEYRLWALGEVPEIDFDESMLLSRYLLAAFRVVDKANPDFDPIAWTSTDAEILTEVGLAFRAALDTLVPGEKLGFALHTYLIFTESTGKWSGTPAALRAARTVVDSAIDGLRLDDFDAERQVLLSVEPMRSLLGILKWIGKGKPTAPGGQLPAGLDACAKKLGISAGLASQLIHYAGNPDHALISYGGDGVIHRGPGAKDWRGGRPPIDQVRDTFSEWVVRLLHDQRSMSNRGSNEEFCAFIDAGSSPIPRGVDWFDSLWDDEDEDDDEMDNEAAEELVLRIHDDPYFVYKPAIREALDEMITYGWMRLEDGKYVVPQGLEGPLSVAMKEFEHQQYLRREEHRRRKSNSRRRRRGRW